MLGGVGQTSEILNSLDVEIRDNLDLLPLQVSNKDLHAVLGDARDGLGSQLSSIASVANDAGSSQYQSKAASNAISSLKDKNIKLENYVESLQATIERHN